MIPVDVPPVPVTPVTLECLASAATGAGVPPVYLAALMAAEGGAVGKSRINKNGSRDHGPMQVNDSWVRRLRLNPDRVANDGCYNLRVGALVFRYELDAAGGTEEIWRAVGNYHTGSGGETRSPTRHIQYRLGVWRRLMSLLGSDRVERWRDLLRRANGFER